MRYPASEKLEIIRLVEQSHLPVRRTLEKLGIQHARFYRWYDRLQTGGLEALEDNASRPTRVWNRIPDAIRERIFNWPWTSPSYARKGWTFVSDEGWKEQRRHELARRASATEDNEVADRAVNQNDEAAN